MKHRLLVIAGIVALVVGSAAFAGAQGGSMSTTVQIGFPFMAGSKAMPAGKYRVDMVGTSAIALRGADGVAETLPIITTLGRHDKDPDPEFVFDKVGGKLLLSEFWFPGKDGFLVLSTKEPHEHAVVGGSNSRQ
jgi:hypothetical protein